MEFLNTEVNLNDLSVVTDQFPPGDVSGSHAAPQLITLPGEPGVLFQVQPNAQQRVILTQNVPPTDALSGKSRSR